MEYKAYALMAILLASVASVGTLGTAYAQTGFTVATNNPNYSTGDDITVSGNVGQTPTGQPLLIQVFNPNGAAYRFDHVTVAADGSYTYTLKVGGSLGVSGEYEVRVSYGGVTRTTTFDFTATDGWSTATLVITHNGQQFNHSVQYQITGGSLVSLVGDSAQSTITATISANNAGHLTIQLPRSLMDSRNNGSDADYIVFVDEFETFEVDDNFGATIRTLTIDFEAGSETIDIIGTFLVPEFGAIAAIILAVAIVGIIVATTRYNKFSFLPKM